MPHSRKAGLGDRLCSVLSAFAALQAALLTVKIQLSLDLPALHTAAKLGGIPRQTGKAQLKDRLHKPILRQGVAQRK